MKNFQHLKKRKLKCILCLDCSCSNVILLKVFTDFSGGKCSASLKLAAVMCRKTTTTCNFFYFDSKKHVLLFIYKTYQIILEQK